MKKNGFTLVELLAVIAILAILVLIVLPNVMDLFNDTKKNSFTNEVKNIFKTAQSQWVMDSATGAYDISYARCSEEECSNQLKLSGREDIEYYISINSDGDVVRYAVKDGTFQFYYGTNEDNPTLTIEEITEVQELSKLNESQIVEISCNGPSGGDADADALAKVCNGTNYEDFANDSWAEIYNNIKKSTCNYRVGDTKTISLNLNGTPTNYQVRVANNTYPSECNTPGFSQSACGFVIEFTSFVGNNKPMNPYSAIYNVNGQGNKGGWKYSDMRYYLNDIIYVALPSDLRPLIPKTTVVSGYSENNDSSNFVSEDYLYLLSTHEVYKCVDANCGTTDNDLMNQNTTVSTHDTAYYSTRQLDYYAQHNVTGNLRDSNNAAAVKGSGKYWWLRSAMRNKPNTFFAVNYIVTKKGNEDLSGKYVSASSENENGVSPAFRLKTTD